MAEKSYFYLLILFNFLCQGIMASLSDDNTSRSSDFLIRNKRVINHGPDGNVLPRFRDIKYLVNIKEHSRNRCAGAILSHFTVITAAFCFQNGEELHGFIVLSGSAYTSKSRTHNVVSKVEHFGNPPIQRFDGIALIKVHPEFTYGINTGPISLHVEPVLPGTSALISGWSCYHPSAPAMELNRLRSITIPIMNHRECAATYDHYFNSNKYICTYDQQKLCGLTDVGTPLVIDNLLVGIHIFKGQTTHGINPDVFLDLQRPEYSVWIRQNIITQ